MTGIFAVTVFPIDFVRRCAGHLLGLLDKLSSLLFLFPSPSTLGNYFANLGIPHFTFATFLFRVYRNRKSDGDEQLSKHCTVFA